MTKRKLFGTDGIRGIANIHPMTPDIALRLGKAIAIVLRSGKKRPKIVIGKDTRISGYIFETALTSGICSAGADVLLVGPMPTPGVAHLTKSFGADAGIVISASHNPSDENGIKIFDQNGYKLSDEKELKIEKLIFSYIKNEDIIGSLIGKAKRIDDAKGRYIEFAKNTINNESLKGLKIVLDCANGAAYSIAPDIFRELGADVTVINNHPDGLNINKDCGAMHPENLKSHILGQSADIGIALDGDADRLIMVDESGDVVNGDHIMAICGLDLLKKNKLNHNTIVATVYSGIGLDETFSKYNGKVIRTDCGDRYVIEEMVKKGYSLGGEQSGHLIFLNHCTTGDGTISALQVLKIIKDSKKKLSELKKSLIVYPQVLKNVNVKKKKKPFNKMKNVVKIIKQAKKELKKDGRIFLRYSGTENKARIMIEGQNNDFIENLAENIAREIKKEVGA